MNKKELMNMRTLLATPTMMKLAAADIPVITKGWYRTETAYQRNLYMRCHAENDILKVAFYLTEHMRAGGKKPVYELYIFKIMLVCSASVILQA